METDLYRSDLKRADKLGRGSYSIVFKGHKKNRNKTPVAIKRIDNDEEFFTENAIQDFKALLAVSGHVNIVELLDLHIEEDFIFIIMEYCNGDLENLLSRGVPSYTVKLDIMNQCARGISYIHGLSPPVIHRDIKPNNILFQESPSGITVKIGDFGLARVFSSITSSIGGMYMSTNVGSLAFRAPELFKSSSELHYTAMIDNYALGLVFAVLVNFGDEDKSLEPHTAGVAPEPYLSFGQRQLQAYNEHLRPPCLYLCPHFSKHHPRMKSLIVDMTSLEATKRTKLHTVQSEIDKAISQQNEEVAGSKAAAELTGKQHHGAAASHTPSDRSQGKKVDKPKLLAEVNARQKQAMKGKSTVSPSVKEKKLAGSTVTQPRASSSSTGSTPSGNKVVVIIHNLSLEDDSELLENDLVSKLFVEYRFLGIAPEETECPYALPKPAPGESISFNFKKIFHVDYENNYERRQQLASMLLPENQKHGKIVFTVVSDPGDEEDDCLDVGKAYVDISKIISSNKDLDNAAIEVYDINDETTVVGRLSVTVKCLDALKAVRLEMK